MFVCFSIGPKSKAIVSSLSKTADNVEFLTFNSIKEIVKNAKLRHIDFKRIIISSKIVRDPDKEFEELSDFIGNYSDKTEVVLVVGEKAAGSVDVSFNKFFNAPLYTPVIMPKANSSALLELVLGDILSLAMKYYDGGNHSIESEKVVEEDENVPTQENTSEDSSSVADPAPNSGFGIGFGPRGIDISNMGTSQETETPSYEESIERGLSKSEVSALGYTESFTNDNYDDDDEDLGIGSYGAEHSDTGYLDEADEGELKAHLREVEAESQQVEVHEEPVVEVAKAPVREAEPQKVVSAPPVEKKEEPPARVMPKPASNTLNIDLVVSTRSYRATQAIIDEALNLYRKDDAKILIVDLDYKENRILSYLKTGEYYRSSSFEGISKQRIYEEDHIGICSNGYGVPVQTSDLKSLLSSRLVKGYELVLIDCPVDCLKVIDEELIRSFHILLYSGGSRQDLVEMSRGIVNRDNVSLSIEKHIMRNCDVEINGSMKKSDLDSLKRDCLFANGTWLNKVS